jgi:putative copper export protein
MNPSVVSLALLTFLHDVFTAFWIGGLMTLAITVAPAARKALGKESTMLIMDAIMKRLSPVIYGCMVGLAVTGAMLSKRSTRFDGLFSFASPYAMLLSVKHLAMLAMVAVALFRSLGVKRLKLSPPRKNAISMGLLLLNLVLGVLILLLSGFVSALG